MMNVSAGDSWVLLKDYLKCSRSEKIYRLSIEIRLTRKGFDVTDFLEVGTIFHGRRGEKN